MPLLFEGEIKVSNKRRRTDVPPVLLKMAPQLAIDVQAAVGNHEGSVICVNYAGKNRINGCIMGLLVKAVH